MGYHCNKTKKLNLISSKYKKHTSAAKSHSVPISYKNEACRTPSI